MAILILNLSLPPETPDWEDYSPYKFLHIFQPSCSRSNPRISSRPHWPSLSTPSTSIFLMKNWRVSNDGNLGGSNLSTSPPNPPDYDQPRHESQTPSTLETLYFPTSDFNLTKNSLLISTGHRTSILSTSKLRYPRVFQETFSIKDARWYLLSAPQLIKLLFDKNLWVDL